MRLLLAAFLLSLPATARAAGGMPQLDFANPLTLSQVVWGAIIFVVLYILASRFALPRVGEVLEERAARIAADLQTAQAAKTRSDAAVVEMTEATAKARADAQTTINAELDKAKARVAEQAAVLNERLERQLVESEAQIVAARNAAMGALRQVATETAVTVVTRLTGLPPDDARVDAAIGGVLTARGLV
ncbi:MAG: F0F1 ATP synthase subunit B' [Acetobacteraceae bacterium]|nr:F0F1 ATP synthase subunit B' [Acetobacteraceae bacterium]